MQGSANLNLMIKAARKAGRSLVKDFREVENLQVSMKGAGDFVSRADIAAEQLIRDELMGARPNYGWLAEESSEEKGADPTRRWIVDPLDGTTNFLHGLPHWAVSIALEHKGEIVAGVVYDPAKDEMFFAEKGQGAWLNQTRLRVSARRVMIEALFATGLPFGTRPDLPDIAIYGPAPAPLSLLRGRYRYRLLINARRSARLQETIRSWLDALAFPRGVRVSIDIDPYSFV